MVYRYRSTIWFEELRSIVACDVRIHYRRAGLHQKPTGPGSLHPSTNTGQWGPVLRDIVGIRRRPPDCEYRPSIDSGADPIQRKLRTKICLGGNIGKHEFENDPIPKWTCSAEKYLGNALEKAKCYLEPKGIVIREKKNVLPPKYHPELDESPYLDEDDATWYSQQVGVLQWAVELGRVDICTATNILSSLGLGLTHGGCCPRIGMVEETHQVEVGI